jgi:hypothetical protein
VFPQRFRRSQRSGGNRHPAGLSQRPLDDGFLGRPRRARTRSVRSAVRCQNYCPHCRTAALRPNGLPEAATRHRWCLPCGPAYSHSQRPQRPSTSGRRVKSLANKRDFWAC